MVNKCILRLLFSFVLILHTAVANRQNDSVLGSFNERKLLSNDDCLAAMIQSDTNGDSKLNDVEYYTFVKLLSDDIPVQDEPTLEIQSKFNVLACLCRSQEGEGCCEGENQSVDIGRAAFSSKYLDSVCFLTEAGIRQSGYTVTLTDRPTASPINNIFQRPTQSPTRTLTSEPTSTLMTFSPTTSQPGSATKSPTTVQPFTEATTKTPITQSPTTKQPATGTPTNAPLTNSPTTVKPDSETPTSSPTTQSVPTTTTPSTTRNPIAAQPVAESLTNRPSTQSLTTAQPVSDDPTYAPTTTIPTTAQLTSVAPTSQRPSLVSPTPTPRNATLEPTRPTLPNLAVSLFIVKFLIVIPNGKTDPMNDDLISGDLVSAMTDLGRDLLASGTSRKQLRRKVQELEISTKISERLEASESSGLKQPVIRSSLTN